MINAKTPELSTAAAASAAPCCALRSRRQSGDRDRRPRTQAGDFPALIQSLYGDEISRIYRRHRYRKQKHYQRHCSSYKPSSPSMH